MTGNAGLMGLTEIAAVLGVSRQRVYELRATNPLFPDPLVRLAMGPVYAEADVLEFLAKWPRKRTGRPPSDQIAPEETMTTLDPRETALVMAALDCYARHLYGTFIEAEDVEAHAVQEHAVAVLQARLSAR